MKDFDKPCYPVLEKSKKFFFNEEFNDYLSIFIGVTNEGIY